MRTAEVDPDQPELLMVAAFELLGKPEAPSQALGPRAILKRAGSPRSGPPDRNLTRQHLVRFLG